MPWKVTNPMNERVKFIADYLSSEYDFAELCADYSISRKTGYKWIQRYNSNGVGALTDVSRAPHNHPNAVPDHLVHAILSARKKHPSWGPKKLIVLLARTESKIILPAASTVGEILKRHGLIKKRRRRVRNSRYKDHLRVYDSPNSIWCADFKGHFGINHKRCHPLTISDGYSRYLLRCKAMPRPLSEPTQTIFESAFKEYGMPEAIRTDNGAPFSTLALGGLSRLAVWWIRLGIRHERIMPGHPEQNGRHERMHRTLKFETAKPPRSSFRAQQRSFDRFVEEYNHIRPHEALNQKVPASIYFPSTKPYPNQIPEPEYPGHFYVVRIYPNGVLSFNTIQWYISGCLSGELIGIEEVDNDRFKVYFGPVLLGIMDFQNIELRRGRQFKNYLIRMDGEITTDRLKERKHLKVRRV